MPAALVLPLPEGVAVEPLPEGVGVEPLPEGMGSRMGVLEGL